MPHVFADNNATTPIASEVLDVMVPYFRERFYNPSSPTILANQVASAVLTARETIARLLGIMDSNELVFTSGATESNNWVLYGASNAYPEKRHIITSQVEHPAIRSVCLAYERRGYEITWLSVDREGMLDCASLKRALRKDTLLVSIMHANNETGVLMPISEMADLVKKHSPTTLFHTDASQTVGKIPIDLGVDMGNVDLLTLTAHKFHGPKGIGGLFIRKGTKFEPMILGGHHENGMRAGTENVPYIIGMAEALRLALQSQSPCREIRDRLQELIERNLPSISILGKCSSRIDNTLAIVTDNIDSDTLLNVLEQDGILASSGSACSSGSMEPSHVLQAMQVPRNLANGALRFSFSRYNVNQDADIIFHSLQRILKNSI